METFFIFATPIVYWILIIVWALISIFYFKKIKQLKGYGKLLKLLLIILAIDAARSFFESLYFGAWYTSYSGLLPISIYNFLANPEIVFIPKIINLIVAVLILVLIIKKWLEYELVEINATFDRQGVEINKLSAAVNQSANSIVITDLRGNIEYTNPKFTKITGYTAEEALGKTPRILNSGQQSKEFYSNMWKIISGGEIWNGEFKNKKKNGKIYWEESTISPIKNDAGEIINYLAIKNDISKLKQHEKKLIKQNEELKIAKAKVEESEEKHRFLFENTPYGVVYQNDKGEIIYANKSSERILGISLNQMQGRKSIDSRWKTTHEDGTDYPGEEHPAMITLKTGQAIYNAKMCVFNPINNFYTIININSLPKFKNNEVNPYLVVTVFDDITEQRNAEKELIKTKEKAEESDQLKTEFINNMSHEIRTPMNGIMGFSEMLGDTNITDEKRANFVKIIQNSGQQLLNVIDDILDISRLGTKQIKVIESDVCLNDVLLESFSTFNIKAKERKIPLYLKKALSDKQSTIRTDITKINKVLSNLLENALKFTNEGFIEFGYQLKNDEIELYVKDTGIGIEKSKHETIFERFSQAEKDLSKKVGGLGLGLSIAKENAELLGGNIRLESKKGEGAIFFFTIPYKPVYKVNEIEKAKMKPKYTILIAEDEEVNYLYIETLLNDVFGLDCIIIHVANGKDAIEACKENKTIDLVLMDIKMPVLNGIEATKKIKELYPDLPIIAQTAYSRVQEKEQAIEAGCDDFISKPISQKAFKTVLATYLNK